MEITLLISLDPEINQKNLVLLDGLRGERIRSLIFWVPNIFVSWLLLFAVIIERPALLLPHPVITTVYTIYYLVFLHDNITTDYEYKEADVTLKTLHDNAMVGNMMEYMSDGMLEASKRYYRWKFSNNSLIYFLNIPFNIYCMLVVWSYCKDLGTKSSPRQDDVTTNMAHAITTTPVLTANVMSHIEAQMVQKTDSRPLNPGLLSYPGTPPPYSGKASSFLDDPPPYPGNALPFPYTGTTTPANPEKQ